MAAILREMQITNDGLTLDLHFVSTLLIGLAPATGERLTWVSLTDHQRRGFEVSA